MLAWCPYFSRGIGNTDFAAVVLSPCGYGNRCKTGNRTCFGDGKGWDVTWGFGFFFVRVVVGINVFLMTWFGFRGGWVVALGGDLKDGDG